MTAPPRRGRGPSVFAKGWYRRALEQNSHPLCRVLLAVMITEQTRYVDVEKRAGITRETIRRWFARTRGNGPTLANIEAAFGVFDLTLMAVPMEWLPERGRQRSCLSIGALRAMLERTEALEAQLRKDAKLVQD